ncbi:MAG: MotA/TolQ/ExbB proton channel family protein [Lentisphaeria bacterium]|nr:MotA/TolQ/ExbB proton channel family protein [Lentisphaeria bacterium]
MYDVIFNSGFIGFLIWVLLFATSTAAAALAIRCGWMLRGRRFESEKVPAEILSRLQAGDWSSAEEYCRGNVSVTAKILGDALPAVHAKRKQERQELLTSLLDRRVREVLRKINSLSLCGNIAPMLGLLGTVTGMVDAFMGLGTAMGPEKASILAISISQALYTTAAGLLVAVPAITLTVFFRNLLEKRVEKVVDGLDRVMSAIPEPEAPEAPAPSRCRSTETRKLPVE